MRFISAAYSVISFCKIVCFFTGWTYDMTFLILLLTALYEPETKQTKCHCKVHPVKKQAILQNEITEYAADMNLILAYYHLKDDWIDEQKVSGFLGTCALRRRVKSAIRKYPRQSRKIQQELKKLAYYEKKNYEAQLMYFEQFTSFEFASNFK